MESRIPNVKLPDENVINEEKLIKLITSGDAVLMVGAGSSKLIGYPLWFELIQELEAEVKDRLQDEKPAFNFRKPESLEDDLDYASRLKKVLTNGIFEATIHRLFEGKECKCDESHIQLLELPFKGIVTTNYDPTLDYALWRVQGNPSNSVILDESTVNRELLRFFQSLNRGPNKDKLILYLHGHYTGPIILCQEDYVNAYSHINEREKWTRHKRILWALMSTRRIVYVGFSMNDPFFQLINRLASEDFGLFDSDYHFMVNRVDLGNENRAQIAFDFAKRIKRNFGIQTVFFEENKENDGLKHYLLELCAKVNMLNKEEQEQAHGEHKPSDTIGTADDEIKTEQLRKMAQNRNKQIINDPD